MEEEADNRTLVVPSPSLVFIQGKEQEIMTFTPISEGGDVVTKELPLELRNKPHTVHCDGWLVFWTTEDKSLLFQLSLWNVFTMENPIYFPKLQLNSEQSVYTNQCILTAPPDNPDCMFILFVQNAPTLIYCRVGDANWTEHSISDDKLRPRSGLRDPVMCNGKIYCQGFTSDDDELLAVVDIKPDNLIINFIDLELQIRKGESAHAQYYMVESCGELFIIILGYSGSSEKFIVNKLEVREVDVFKVDFEGRCHMVENFEGRAFFLDSYPYSSFSCPASEPGVKGNHVYFSLQGDQSIYAYNMEDGTVLFSKPLPNIQKGVLTTFWLRKGLRSSDNLQKEIMHAAAEETKSELTSQSDTAKEGGIGKLPSDLLVEIGKRLQLTEYMKFRAVNTRFKSAAPLKRWTKSVVGNITSPPLLMTWRVSNNVWNFIDPLYKDERYFMTHNSDLHNAKICYSKGSWCILTHDTDSISLWNPLTKKTIKLPPLPMLGIAGCSFSSSPDSSESDCTVVLLINFCVAYFIGYIKLGGAEWNFRDFKSHNKFNTLAKDNRPIFYKGAIYFLDEDGNLGIYNLSDVEDEDGARGENEDGDGEGEGNEHDDAIGDELDDEDDGAIGDEHEGGNPNVDGDAYGDEDENFILDDDLHYEVLSHIIDCPCEYFHQKFLLECDGQLLSVFVGFLGGSVQVYKFDESQMTWTDVENLGNYTLYLSHFSAFSIIASPGMQNRIYFPRYYGEKSVIYYSLESGMFHSHDTEEDLEDFYNTKEQLLCGWVTPTL